MTTTHGVIACPPPESVPTAFLHQLGGLQAACRDGDPSCSFLRPGRNVELRSQARAELSCNSPSGSLVSFGTGKKTLCRAEAPESSLSAAPLWAETIPSQTPNDDKVRTEGLRMANPVLTETFASVERISLSETELAVLTRLGARNSILVKRGSEHPIGKALLREYASEHHHSVCREMAQ